MDEFKKLINDFNQAKEKLGTKSEVAILINSLHDTYKEVKSALKYGRESVLVDVVYFCLEEQRVRASIRGKKWSPFSLRGGIN